MKDFIRKSRFIHVINADNYCLVRAILIGKAFSDKEKNAWTLVRKNNKELNRRVYQLADQLGLTDEHLNLNHVKLIETFLKFYKLTVYDSIKNGSSILYPTFEEKNDRRELFINICFENAHFNVIQKMTSYLKCNLYCHFCRVKYSNRGDHNCEHICKSCFRYDFKCKEAELAKCPDCQVVSRNITCRNLHNYGTCYKQKICEKCTHLLSRRGTHICLNERWCANCQESVNIEHMCFIKKTQKKKFREKFRGFVWFDIETFVNSENYHEANLIMAKRKCNDCLDDKISSCELCCQKYAFYNMEEFVSWCLQEYNKYFTFIAHNGKSFDFYFVMRYLQKNRTSRDSKHPLKPLVDGLKILTFRFRTLTFKDSSLFIVNKLEQFPKIFGIKSLQKGFFCHAFNKPENFAYIGKYPDKSYYQSEYFPSYKKDAFDLWYESVKDDVFDFKKELEAYCWDDVQILAEGCLIYGKINEESSKTNDVDQGLQPFKTSLTKSSYCNTLYRRNFMPENSIAWFPANGLNPREKTSKKADQWLKYVSESQNIYIRHSKNGGEKKLGPYKVDGYCREKKKIFEFHG